MLSFSDQQLETLRTESVQFQQLTGEIGKAIVGQHEIISFALMSILCNGHVLLEGVPGVAKTTLIKAIARALGLEFKRIQFTPDLLPADLIGTLMYNQKTHEFETKKGPIFANLVLADEINRAPAKVQSALLEAMQEHQVTIGSSTFTLEEPFLVFATQNPVEQEGTYRLPEAQVDRFLFKLTVDYPTIHEERQIIQHVFQPTSIHKILTQQDIFNAQQVVKNIYVDEKIVGYILDIIFATRSPQTYGLQKLQPLIQYGASPRATLALHHASRAHAFLKGRHFVTPDDVKMVAHAVLRHRIILGYEAEASNITTEDIINQILNIVIAP
jgi:MoxR-like ATPase